MGSGTTLMSSLFSRSSLRCQPCARALPAAAVSAGRARAGGVLAPVQWSDALAAQGGDPRRDVREAGIPAGHLLEEIQRLAVGADRVEGAAELVVQLGRLVLPDAGAVQRLLVVQQRLGGRAPPLETSPHHGEGEALVLGIVP